MTEFLVLGVIMTIVVGLFVSTIIINLTLENAKVPIKIIVGALIAFAIGFLISFGLVSEENGDEERWNNGICTNCGKDYRFANADRNRNQNTIYYWACDECGNVIGVHTKFIKK